MIMTLMIFLRVRSKQHVHTHQLTITTIDALNEFEQEQPPQRQQPSSSSRNATQNNNIPTTTTNNTATTGGSDEQVADVDLDSIFNSMSSDEQKVVEKLAADMAEFIGKLQLSDDNPTSTNASTSSSSGSTPTEKLSVEETIKRTMEKLKENTAGMEVTIL
jgi:hypothetical protein